MTYTFRGPGGERTVEAKTEAEARHLAMLVRWGPPDGIYASPYEGKGLDLIFKKK